MHLVPSSECERGKPDPAPYVEGLRRLGLAAENVIALEDSPAGIKSAVDAVRAPSLHFARDGVMDYGCPRGDQISAEGIISVQKDRANLVSIVQKGFVLGLKHIRRFHLFSQRAIFR